MRITISGPPGSGKTTVCNILSERLGIDAAVFGRIFRSFAAERGLTLSELGEMAENDRSIDEAIDSKILEMARENEDLILESRLSAHMLRKNDIPAFCVYLDADPGERIRRIGMRDGESVADAEENTFARQSSEAKRYMKYYGIDINDKSVYDLVLDTDELMPEQVADAVVEAMRGRTC